MKAFRCSEHCDSDRMRERSRDWLLPSRTVSGNLKVGCSRSEKLFESSNSKRSTIRASPCLVTIEDGRYGILCSVSPPLSKPKRARKCLNESGIHADLIRDHGSGGDIFMFNNVSDWKAVHVVDAVNSIRFCMVYGEDLDKPYK